MRVAEDDWRMIVLGVLYYLRTTHVQVKFVLNKMIDKFSFICSTVIFNISRHTCGARHPL